MGFDRACISFRSAPAMGSIVPWRRYLASRVRF
jgi:hypothetical protein